MGKARHPPTQNRLRQTDMPSPRITSCPCSSSFAHAMGQRFSDRTQRKLDVTHFELRAFVDGSETRPRQDRAAVCASAMTRASKNRAAEITADGCCGHFHSSSLALVVVAEDRHRRSPGPLRSSLPTQKSTAADAPLDRQIRDRRPAALWDLAVSRAAQSAPSGLFDNGRRAA